MEAVSDKDPPGAWNRSGMGREADGWAGVWECALCGRPIPSGARASRHHLTPKMKGGARKGTVPMHQICHNAIHARYSEAEIARRLADVGSLRADPDLARFIAWVRDKPPGFYALTRGGRRR